MKKRFSPDVFRPIAARPVSACSMPRSHPPISERNVAWAAACWLRLASVAHLPQYGRSDLST
eukprot:scaffold27417_cov56-Phaeocystis_antarctica.AAC.2